MPVTSTCFTVPSSTLLLNCVRLNSASLGPGLTFFSTWKIVTKPPAKSTQKMIVFMVEFTEQTPQDGRPNAKSGRLHQSLQIRCRTQHSDGQKCRHPYSTPLAKEKFQDVAGT